MKNYTITVNGKTYDVTVEEGGGSASAPRSQAVTAPAAVAAPTASTGAGSVRIEAGAAGKVFKLNVPVGTVVKKGDTVLTLEVMKMETPVVAAQDGTVASIEVAEGQQVEAGDLLATMN